MVNNHELISELSEYVPDSKINFIVWENNHPILLNLDNIQFHMEKNEIPSILFNFIEKGGNIMNEKENTGSEKSANPITRFKKLINEKEKILNILNQAINENIMLESRYHRKYNDLLLNTKWNEVIEGRATEKLKEAYIESELVKDIELVKISNANVSGWKREIDLLNDEISLEKYRLRMRDSE